MKKEWEILILISVALLCGCNWIDRTESQNSVSEYKSENVIKEKLKMDREELNRLRHEFHIHIAAMRDIYIQ